ncbi:MAG: hypothetical protein AAB215_00605 [Planctomycetota bacterium]
MTRERTASILRAAALASWAALILVLAARGRLSYLVQVRNPVVFALTYAGAAALLFLAFAALRTERPAACPCADHAHSESPIRPLGILALALLALALLALPAEPRRLGLAAAGRMETPDGIELLGFGDDASAGAYEPANLLMIRYAAERDPLSLFDRSVVLEGIRKKIPVAPGSPRQVIGAPDSLYQLVRFTMTCCVADAFPVALTVLDESGPPPPEGSWVQAVGTLQWDRKNRAPVLVARRVVEISEPEAPYLSPSDRELDFLTGIGARKPGSDAPPEDAP